MVAREGTLSGRSALVTGAAGGIGSAVCRAFAEAGASLALLDMAPPESRDVIKEYGRPIYDKLIADLPTEVPLAPAQLVAAFRRWDEEIGAKKLK